MRRLVFPLVRQSRYGQPPARPNNIVWNTSKAIALEVRKDPNATPMDRRSQPI
jgi:hypothetical protein